MLKVTLVSQPRLPIEIETHFKISMFDLERLGEAGQTPQCPPGKFCGLRLPREIVQLQSQLRGQNRRERSTFGSFNSQATQIGLLCIQAEPVQQNCLADTPEAHQKQTLRRPLSANPRECDPHFFTQLIAPSQLGRRRTSPGCERVFFRSHDTLIQSLSRFTRFA